MAATTAAALAIRRGLKRLRQQYPHITSELHLSLMYFNWPKEIAQLMYLYMPPDEIVKTGVTKYVLGVAAYDPQPLLTAAVESGDGVEALSSLLRDKRIDPSADSNAAVRLAAKKGHVEMVRLLLSDERVASDYRLLHMIC